MNFRQILEKRLGVKIGARIGDSNDYPVEGALPATIADAQIVVEQSYHDGSPGVIEILNAQPGDGRIGLRVNESGERENAGRRGLRDAIVVVLNPAAGTINTRA